MKTAGAAVLRRALYGVFASCVVGAAAVAAMAGPTATASNDPCAASEVARTIGSVSTNTGNYLDSHPDTNNALTVASQQQGPQALAAMKTYFDAHPQAGKGRRVNGGDRSEGHSISARISGKRDGLSHTPNIPGPGALC